MIEDGSQRSYFPNGFPFFVYGQTLFDTSSDFDKLTEDYFSHIYGEDWKEVYTLLKTLGETFDHKYLEGKLYIDKPKGKYYNPEHAKNIRKVRGIIEDFRPFLNTHKNMPMRAQTVAYRVLERYLEYCEGIAKVLVLKCVGANEEAIQEYAIFLNELGKHEVEIERFYDQSLYGMTFGLYIDIVRGALKEQKKALNV
jgi:hypothetical protein